MYGYSLEGWVAPDGLYTGCGSDDHTVTARRIIDAAYKEHYNAHYFDAQTFLLDMGYVRLDIHSIAKRNREWGGLTDWQVWTLHEIYNLKPKRSFFPYKLLRLLLVANGVDYLRQPNDNVILSGNYTMLESALERVAI